MSEGSAPRRCCWWWWWLGNNNNSAYDCHNKNNGGAAFKTWWNRFSIGIVVTLLHHVLSQVSQLTLTQSVSGCYPETIIIFVRRGFWPRRVEIRGEETESRARGTTSPLLVLLLLVAFYTAASASLMYCVNVESTSKSILLCTLTKSEWIKHIYE